MLLHLLSSLNIHCQNSLIHELVKLLTCKRERMGIQEFLTASFQKTNTDLNSESSEHAKAVHYKQVCNNSGTLIMVKFTIKKDKVKEKIYFFKIKFVHDFKDLVK